MIDHFGIGVRDFERALGFYQQVLAPLGYGSVYHVPLADTGGAKVAGFGSQAACGFWINESDQGGPALHFAFKAATKAQVDAFYTAALNAGGTDNGQPGLRPQYHPSYYGAFVLDLDGNNIEAVCHHAED
jgi:catechol 2,3-dioxygenase-like lactoylglutathione lyase family enzyme